MWTRLRARSCSGQQPVRLGDDQGRESGPGVVCIVRARRARASASSVLSISRASGLRTQDSGLSGGVLDCKISIRRRYKERGTKKKEKGACFEMLAQNRLAQNIRLAHTVSYIHILVHTV